MFSACALTLTWRSVLISQRDNVACETNAEPQRGCTCTEEAALVSITQMCIVKAQSRAFLWTK